MGERVGVTLKILTSQRSKAEALPAWCAAGSEYNYGDCTFYEYSEVNYGNLDFLTDLRNAGIAYDSTWESGSDFGPGTASMRFSPEGETVEKELYTHKFNPNMSGLLTHIDNPVALRQYILDHQEERAVLPLDEYQVAYGKLYRMKQLIAPTQV